MTPEEILRDEFAFLFDTTYKTLIGNTSDEGDLHDDKEKLINVLNKIKEVGASPFMVFDSVLGIVKEHQQDFFEPLNSHHDYKDLYKQYKTLKKKILRLKEPYSFLQIFTGPFVPPDKKMGKTLRFEVEKAFKVLDGFFLKSDEIFKHIYSMYRPKKKGNKQYMTQKSRMFLYDYLQEYKLKKTEINHIIATVFSVVSGKEFDPSNIRQQLHDDMKELKKKTSCKSKRHRRKK